LVSVEAVNRSFTRRLALNHAILNNKYWYLPVDYSGHEDYMPVGRGVQTSEACGQWSSYVACENVEAHKGVFLGGADCSGKIVVRHKHLWCHKSSCPICFIRGWSVREARSIEGRIVEAEKRGLGKPEHVTVSPSVVDRDLPESVLRVKCRKALLDRGVVGGCMIFHGFREDRSRHVLALGVHYHILGFVEGGFDRCRNCVHNRSDCASCDGLKGREVRGFARDGYLVKVHDRRKTIFGTAVYQLNHATIRIGIKRFMSVTWFGSVSYSKFKAEKLMSKDVCPACKGEMSRVVYVGKRHIVKDIGSSAYVALFLDDEFDASGAPNYVDFAGGRHE